ncbi:MAG: type IV secretion system protein [Rickettsia endosymbiont of Bryobia graminum]|nr:type IV secretion system protein [Rickettsia endosymbiont of Bryobia graminum]
MISLSGCTGDRCIDADDFGFIKFVISARYKKPTPHKDDYSSDDQEGTISAPQPDNQSAPWVPTGYNINGQPLTILVKTWDFKQGDKNSSSELSAWGPWFGKEDNTRTLSDFSKRLQECRFIDDNMCTKTKDARISNAPCLFKDGRGLYFLIAERYTDPNVSEDSQRAPKGITGHLGEKSTGYQLYDLTKRGEHVKAGGVNYQYQGNEAVNFSQCPLYFKILDKFYDDNSGQYRVVIKSGVSDTRPDPLEFLTDLIKKELFGDDKHQGLVRSVYENIIKTPGYRITVSALLTLYIMFTAFSFLIGNVNFTHTELIIRLLKVSIVSIMLSSASSWQFFHDYLFVYFIEGVEQILQIIKETGNTGPRSSSIIGLMIAPQTMAKLFSLLFVDPLGFIYIFLFLIALYFIFMMVFKATIIYLSALITIGMIITMAPIFICFMLFNITRSLFENWLKQLISYAIQPIILFAGIAFISMIARSEIYSSLGFAVCKYDFPNLGPINDLFGKVNDNLDSSLGDSIFYWWFPSPMKASKFSKLKADILVPVDHRVLDGTEYGKLCLAYECKGSRYIEFPFLDPVKDVKRLTDFFNGNFVQLDGLLLIFLCVYLLKKFNEVAVSSANFLSNTSGNLTNLQGVGESAFKPIERKMDKPINYVSDFAKGQVNRITAPISQGAAETYESIMTKGLEIKGIKIIKGLEGEALGKSAKSSVLDEVKRKYGISRGDVKADAVSSYRTALEGIGEKIKNDNPNAKFDINDLSTKKYSVLQDNIAEIKFGAGKKFKDLNKDQQEEIKNFLKTDGKRNLKELASDAQFTEAFKKAYVESHLSMSERGVGLFGKSIAPLRMWQELDNRVKSKKKLDKDEKYNRGERIFAGYEAIKRAAVTGVGEDLRNAFEGNLTGAEWHDFDYNDPRLRTYSEALKDKQREIEYKKFNNKINKETIAVGEDILSPEYLARLETQGRGNESSDYEKMSHEKLKMEIYEKLSGDEKKGEEPVLMGERFMREKASDTQTRDMINLARQYEQDLLNNDRYIAREERYEAVKEKAEDNIRDILPEALLSQYKVENNGIEEINISKEQIPDLVNQYLQTQDPNRDRAEIQKEVNSLQVSVNNLEYSNTVLTKIDERKRVIREVVKEGVDNINKYRRKAGMTEYNE